MCQIRLFLSCHGIGDLRVCFYLLSFILACICLTVKILREIKVLKLLQKARVHIAKFNPGPDLTENKRKCEKLNCPSLQGLGRGT